MPRSAAGRRCLKAREAEAAVMIRRGQVGGRRWQTKERAGLSHAEAGRSGGKERVWQPPRSPETAAEVALRWFLGEATQVALAEEYGVARSTVRRWCAAREEEGG